MFCATDPARDLLFGLLALQNGLIEQGQLVAAFQAWTRDKDRPLAEHLRDHGDLDADQRAAVAALVDLHVKKHGGDPENSLAALAVGRSTRESLARLADADLEASLVHLGSRATAAPDDLDRTASYAVGAVTSDGQRFRVLRPHAQGGLGAVFVALDCELHREVALKQILDQHADDPESRQRFLMEAEITGGLEHPGIVPVYGLGSYADGRPYYAMRFIRGDSLKEAIAQFHADAGLKQDPGRRSLELHQLLRRFVDVCNAIDYAHSRGVLHRDLKPGNVIIGRYGETLVVDWGLAKPLGHAEPPGRAEERTLVPSSGSGTAGTLPGSALGTPPYMSPEQAAGDIEHLGPRSDVYSLGATLYCLLTGRVPFEGDDPGAILRGVQAGDFPAPRAVDPRIDRALEAVCLKAMARKPEDRYATPKALAEDVERWKADEPVTAWREPWARRTRRWVRRHRTLVTAAAAVLVMALAGLGTVAAVQARANADLRAANARERERFNLAMEAIGKFHSGISEDVLLKRSEFKELRERLLRDAQQYYGKLLGLLKDQPDAGSRQALGKAYYQLAGLLDAIGKKDEALEAHRQSLAVRRELAARPGADEQAVGDYGDSLLKTGECLLWGMGRYDDAMPYLKEGLRLAETAPNGRAHRVVQAKMDYTIGWIQFRTGLPDEALACFQRSLAIVEAELADPQPRAPIADLRRGKAVLWSAFGAVKEATGHLEEALACQLKYLELMKELAKEEPNDPEIRGGVRAAYAQVGREYEINGRLEEALTAFLEAQRLVKELAETAPNDREVQRDLAAGQLGLAFRLVKLGRREPEWAGIEDGIRRLKTLAHADPSDIGLQDLLVQFQHSYGSLLEEVGRSEKALAAYEEARPIIERVLREVNPSESKFQGHRAWNAELIGNFHRRRDAGSLAGRALTLARSGHPAEAVKDYRDAIATLEGLESKFETKLTLDQYQLACDHARLAQLAGAVDSGLSAAEGPAELDRAMECLCAAVAAGFRDLAHIRTDPDLDPLRARTDFQLLMMDLAFPDEPFSKDRDADR
jgi:serine/threonine-protein kinase